MAEPSLDDVLSDDYTHEDVVETETTEDVAEVETGEPEPEEIATPEVEAKEEPPSSEPKDNRIDPEQFKGYLEEREKRQALERKLEEMQKQLPQPEEVKVDPLEDPEGFQAQVDQRLKQAEFNIERKFMAKLHDDWDKAEEWINEQISTNDAIKAKLAGSDSILEDAYSLWTQHQKLQALESADPEALREQIRQEVLAELKGEVEKEAEAKEAESKATGKPSLATTGTSTGIEVEGLLALEDLLPGDSIHR